MIGDPKKKRKPRRQRHKESIIHCKDGHCFICMTQGDFSIKPMLHKHHVFGGPRRKISEAEGLTVYLCPEHHTMGPEAVHKNHDMMRMLQREGQRAFEETHTREQWMMLMGKNYFD